MVGPTRLELATSGVTGRIPEAVIHQTFPNLLGIGNIAARYVITTENGGGDQYLWFGYNYGFKWTSEGRCRIHEESYGLWSPLGEKKYHKPMK